jgi:hypothetical protein
VPSSTAIPLRRGLDGGGSTAVEGGAGLGTVRPVELAPDATLARRSLPAGFEGQRFQFELLVLAPLAAVVAACSFFYLASRRSGWSSASASSS